jgi:hypothetical protein
MDIENRVDLLRTKLKEAGFVRAGSERMDGSLLVETFFDRDRNYIKVEIDYRYTENGGI